MHLYQSAQKKLFQFYSELYNKDCETLSKKECLAKCEEIFASLCVTEEQCRFTEEKNQKSIQLHIRTGRITASRIKSVCVTSINNQPKSLVNAICYPTTTKFATNTTHWGYEHEDTARERYRKEQEGNHHNCKCEKVDLY